MIVLGIDPGARTGIAIFAGGVLSELKTVTPHQIHAMLSDTKPSRVIFEDSRLESHTWTQVKSRPAALKMARNVGEIDAWCKLIVGLCETLKIPAHSISPQGKGAKLDAAKFAAATGWTGKSNQHERDAAIVAWRYRGARA